MSFKALRKTLSFFPRKSQTSPARPSTHVDEPLESPFGIRTDEGVGLASVDQLSQPGAHDASFTHGSFFGSEPPSPIASDGELDSDDERYRTPNQTVGHMSIEERHLAERQYFEEELNAARKEVEIKEEEYSWLEKESAMTIDVLESRIQQLETALSKVSSSGEKSGEGADDSEKESYNQQIQHLKEFSEAAIKECRTLRERRELEEKAWDRERTKLEEQITDLETEREKERADYEEKIVILLRQLSHATDLNLQDTGGSMDKPKGELGTANNHQRGGSPDDFATKISHIESLLEHELDIAITTAGQVAAPAHDMSNLSVQSLGESFTTAANFGDGSRLERSIDNIDVDDRVGLKDVMELLDELSVHIDNMCAKCQGHEADNLTRLRKDIRRLQVVTRRCAEEMETTGEEKDALAKALEDLKNRQPAENDARNAVDQQQLRDLQVQYESTSEKLRLVEADKLNLEISSRRRIEELEGLLKDMLMTSETRISSLDSDRKKKASKVANLEKELALATAERDRLLEEVTDWQEREQSAASALKVEREQSFYLRERTEALTQVHTMQKEKIEYLRKQLEAVNLPFDLGRRSPPPPDAQNLSLSDTEHTNLVQLLQSLRGSSTANTGNGHGTSGHHHQRSSRSRSHSPECIGRAESPVQGEHGVDTQTSRPGGSRNQAKGRESPAFDVDSNYQPLPTAGSRSSMMGSYPVSESGEDDDAIQDAERATRHARAMHGKILELKNLLSKASPNRVKR